MSNLARYEYDFNKSKWINPGSKQVYVPGVIRVVQSIKCAQFKESEASAICLLYTGSGGTNYVVIYNPGFDEKGGARLDGFKEIYIPPTLDGEYEEAYSNFDFTPTMIVHSLRNRSREFEAMYDIEGKEILDPVAQPYAGFLVWDFKSKSKLPVREKYFDNHFTNFTIAGSSIWTCSPSGSNSSIYNVSLDLEASNQTLTVPDVTYLKNYFNNAFLRATFQNGSLIRIPFDNIFKLPADTSLNITFIILGLLLLALVGVYLALKYRKKQNVTLPVASSKKRTILKIIRENEGNRSIGSDGETEGFGYESGTATTEIRDFTYAATDKRIESVTADPASLQVDEGGVIL